MKWIGQHIYDLVSRFRDDVYLEDISTGTIASGAHLGLDSNNKIVKAADGGGDLTSIVAGTGLSGSSLTGPIPTLNVDAAQTQITSIGTIATGVWNGTVIANAYLDADTAHLTTAQTFTGSKTIGTDVKLNFRDANSYINSPTANDLEIVATDITLDAAGSIFMEASDLTIYDPVNDGNPTLSIGSSATNRFEISVPYNSGTQALCDVDFKTYTTSTTTNDGRFSFLVDEVLKMGINDGGMTVYGAVNSNADGAYVRVSSSTTSSATQGGKLELQSDDGAAMGDDHRLGVIEFKGAEDASNTRTTGARIEAMCDAAWSASENGARLDFYTTDANASESKVLTLDSDKLATFPGAVTVTGALTGTLATVTQGNITACEALATIGTITTGVWRGSVIASSYLDADTAHLSGTQSFTGTKTFDETISGAIDGNAATATVLATTRAIGGVNFNGSAAIDLPGVNAAGNQSTSGLAATATLAADATTLATPRAINGVDFDGSAAITIPTNQIWGAYIKLLPTDFMPNDDGGTSKGITLNDSGTTGMKPGVAAMELVAIADIPEGFTATHVDIYDNSHDLTIKVYEMNINASGMALKGTGAANTTLDMTDVESTVTNFLAIRVETTGTSERVFGGRITIAPN
jgi:hypothetical protein